MAAHVLHVVLVQLLVKVRKRSSAVYHMITLGHGLARNHGRDGPRHSILGRSRRSLDDVGVGGTVVQDCVRVEVALVRAALVLDHSGLAAEALAAAVIGTFVWALAGVNAAMTGKRG